MDKRQLKKEDFIEKIGESWWKYLGKFFESEEAYNIYQTLKSDSKKDKITPKSSDTWKFLKLTNPNTIKAIVIGLDSYPGQYSPDLYHATGIPFDCSNVPAGKRIQPSLEEFWDGIQAEYNEEFEHTPNLEFLLTQGLFLGNAGITCKLFKTGSHISLWLPFWKSFFEEFVSTRPDIPIVYLGKEAENLKKFAYFNPQFSLTHPSFAARTGQTWDTQGVFKKINEINKSNNGDGFDIIYNYPNYKHFLDENNPPF